MMFHSEGILKSVPITVPKEWPEPAGEIHCRRFEGHQRQSNQCCATGLQDAIVSVLEHLD